MDIIQKEKDGIIICYISGEINIDTATDVKKTFSKLISRKEKRVILNLEGVSYIDSLGIATIISFLRDLKRIQGIVVLSNVSSRINSIFSITKMDKAFQIYEFEEEAFRELQDY